MRGVVTKAEPLAKGANPALHRDPSLGEEGFEARRLYERIYCARGRRGKLPSKTHRKRKRRGAQAGVRTELGEQGPMGLLTAPLHPSAGPSSTSNALAGCGPPPPRWVSPQRISKTSRFQDVGESLGAPAGARWAIDGRTNESMSYTPLVKGGRAQGPPLQRSRSRRIRTRKGTMDHAEIVFPQPASVVSQK